MNKKVSEQFKDIKDIYLLQCICTEQNDKIYELHSIIKEVREYANSLTIFENIKEVILGILDKENK